MCSIAATPEKLGFSTSVVEVEQPCPPLPGRSVLTIEQPEAVVRDNPDGGVCYGKH